MRFDETNEKGCLSVVSKWLSSNRNDERRAQNLNGMRENCHHCRRPVARQVWSISRRYPRHKIHLHCLRHKRQPHSWKIQEIVNGRIYELRICYICRNVIVGKVFENTINSWYKSCEKCKPNNNQWILVSNRN